VFFLAHRQDGRATRRGSRGASDLWRLACVESAVLRAAPFVLVAMGADDSPGSSGSSDRARPHDGQLSWLATPSTETERSRRCGPYGSDVGVRAIVILLIHRRQHRGSWRRTRRRCDDMSVMLLVMTPTRVPARLFPCLELIHWLQRPRMPHRRERSSIASFSQQFEGSQRCHTTRRVAGMFS